MHEEIPWINQFAILEKHASCLLNIIFTGTYKVWSIKVCFSLEFDHTWNPRGVLYS